MKAAQVVTGPNSNNNNNNNVPSGGPHPNLLGPVGPMSSNSPVSQGQLLQGMFIV